MKRTAALLVTLVVAGALLPAGTAHATEADVAAVIGVVVKLEMPDRASLDGVIADHGGSVGDGLVESRGIYLLEDVVYVKADKLDYEADKEAKEWAKDLEKDDRVAWAEPEWREAAEDARFHAWPDSTYDEVGGDDLDEDDVKNQEAFESLSLDEAHEIATGSGAIVAVLDSGVDASHPLLAERLLAGYDLVDDDADPRDVLNGVDDDGDGLVDEAYGHGTFVAGIVAQIAPDADILPVRVLDAEGRGHLYAVVDGIDMAIEGGADVINLSFSLPDDHKPAPLKDALKRAKDAGVVVVGAAGNRADDRKLYPASEGSVISVGAIGGNDHDEVAGFSSHGKWVLLAAPGVDIVSAVPGGGHAVWTGTSMATPVVAGQAALLFQIAPEAEQKDVRKALKDSARKMRGKKRADKGEIDILESLARLS